MFLLFGIDLKAVACVSRLLLRVTARFVFLLSNIVVCVAAMFAILYLLLLLVVFKVLLFVGVYRYV